MNNTKVIKARDNTYIFDANTGVIVKEDGTPQTFNHTPEKPVDLSYEKHYGDLMLSELKNNICDSQFYFVYTITYQCTFRCKYCVYCGGYEHQREHKDQHISEEVIAQSFDFLETISEKAQELFICFYDESLIRFDTIKTIIEKVKSQSFYQQKKVHFIITSNGLILENELIRNFLIDNNCILYISLDGPQEIHDEWRVNVSGKPTWEKIINIMEKIKDKNPDYYYNNVIYQAVIVDQTNLRKINDFFNHFDLTAQNRIIGRMISKTDIKELLLNKLPLEQPLMKTEIVGYYLDNIARGHYDQIKFLNNFWGYYLKKIHFRNINNSLTHRICIPGKRKVFIDISGDIYNCEKHGGSTKIGSMKDGLNFEKITTMVNHFTEHYFNECIDCWAKNLCDICYDCFLAGVEIDEKRMKCFCEKEKKQWEQYLYLYLCINELDPQYFDTILKHFPSLNEAKCGF